VIDQYVSTSELRRLVASLMVVIGAILIFGLFAFIVVPGLRNANRPMAALASEPSTGDLGWLDPTEYPSTPGYDVPPLDPKVVTKPNTALLTRGRELYAQNCVACHGPNGAGNGAAGVGLKPPPRNFTAGTGWKNGTGLGAIFKTLRTGVPGSAMLPYDFLTKRDRIALAHHVRSLPPSPLPDDDPAARTALESELAAPGERVPNRIPVSLAGKILATEYEPPQPLRADVDNSPLLSRAIRDRVRADAMLRASTEWRQSPVKLAHTLAVAVPGNGFHPEIATYTAEEWQELWTELIRVVPEGRAPALSARGTAQ
jgi:mono/diheme cytochrome c family protein